MSLRLSLEDLARELLESDLSPEQGLGIFEIWKFYSTGELKPEEDPFHTLRMFNVCVEAGFPPPPAIMEWLASAFTKTLQNATESNRRTLDELLDVQGPKREKKKIHDFRDSVLSREFHILTTRFGFTQLSAAEAIINKYSEKTTYPDARPGLMTELWRNVVGVPKSAERLIQIYNDYKKIFPEQFKGSVYPDFFDDSFFLNSFAKEDIKEMVRKKK